MTDAREPGPDETMPLPRATEPPESPDLAAAGPVSAGPAAASPAGAGPTIAPAPAAGYVPAPPVAGYPPAPGPAGYVPGPGPAPGRGRVPLVAIVLGGVLVVLLAVGGGFAGGFVVGHAVGSRDGGISIQGPDRMMRGFDGPGESGQLSPGGRGGRDRNGTGLGNLPRLGERVGPNSGTAPAEPAPVPSPSS